MSLDVLDAYLSVLVGSAPGRRVIDVRRRVPDGMRKQGIPALAVDRAAATIRGHARRSDTYVGVLLREGRAGGKEYVSRSHLIWIEIDAPDSAQRLADAPQPPTMVVTSGIIRSGRSRGPESTGDACWRRVANTSYTTDGIRCCRRSR